MTEPNVLHFRLAVPPNFGNARHGHHMQRHRQGKAYKQLACNAIAVQLQEQTRTRLLVLPWQHVVVTAELWVRARYDDDGAVGLLKHPLDALVQAGVIKDDKQPWCRLGGIPEQHVLTVRRRKSESAGEYHLRKLTTDYRLELKVEAVDG